MGLHWWMQKEIHVLFKVWFDGPDEGRITFSWTSVQTPDLSSCLFKAKLPFNFLLIGCPLQTRGLNSRQLGFCAHRQSCAPAMAMLVTSALTDIIQNQEWEKQPETELSDQPEA